MFASPARPTPFGIPDASTATNSGCHKRHTSRSRGTIRSTPKRSRVTSNTSNSLRAVAAAMRMAVKSADLSFAGRGVEHAEDRAGLLLGPRCAIEEPVIAAVAEPVEPGFLEQVARLGGRPLLVQRCEIPQPDRCSGLLEAVGIEEFVAFQRGSPSLRSSPRQRSPSAKAGMLSTSHCSAPGSSRMFRRMRPARSS